MWKLTIEDDQGNRIPVPLVRDEYSIGRGAENTLRLTEQNVSRQHAKVLREDGRWFLVDLESYNGSYINGERVIERQELADGDLIQLGDYRIQAIEEAEAAAALPMDAGGEGGAILTVDASPDRPESELPTGLAGEDLTAPAGAPFATDAEADLAAHLAPKRSVAPNLTIAVAVALGLGLLAFFMLRPDSSTSEADPALALNEPAPVPSEPAVAAEEPALEPAPAEEEPAQAHAAIGFDEEGEFEDLTEIAEIESEEGAAPTVAGDEEPAAAPREVTAAAASPRPAAPAKAAPAKAPTKAADSGRAAVLAANPFDPPPTERKTTKGQSAKAPQAPGGQASLADLAAQGREGEAKMRPILEQRVARGDASTKDIRLLRAICRNMGDRACADRMSALLADRP